jgi:hypothetical protein
MDRKLNRVVCFFVILIALGFAVQSSQSAAQDKTGQDSITNKTSSTKPASTSNKPKEEVLTNDSVMQLLQAGLDEDLIISKIQKTKYSFDTSTQGLVALQKGGVSKRLLAFMMDPTKPPEAKLTPVAAVATPVVAQIPSVIPVVVPSMTSNRPTGATQGAAPETNAPAGDPSDPAAAHDSGIYLLKGPGGRTEMIVLEPAAYTGSKTGGLLTSALTYGIKKAKQKAIIQGQKANIRTSDASPIFYFYFEDKAAALGKGGFFGAGSISSPNQFSCIKLDVKKGTRETIVMEIGAFGTSSGTHQDSIKAFKSDRTRPGVYKVTFPSPLEPGEYAFLVGSTNGTGASGAAMPLQIFDFGVSSGE